LGKAQYVPLNRVTSRSTPSFSSRSFSIFARLFVTCSFFGGGCQG
jgi:hypothetical protein